MTLQKETKVGMTFGQIISVLTIIGGLIISWVSINVRIAEAEVRIEQLECGRISNAQNIEKIRIENREDHQRIMEKLDYIYQDAKRENRN